MMSDDVTMSHIESRAVWVRRYWNVWKREGTWEKRKIRVQCLGHNRCGVLGDLEFAKNVADHSQPEVQMVCQCLLVIISKLSNCIRVQSTLWLLR